MKTTISPSQDWNIDCGTQKTLVITQPTWNDSMIPASSFRTTGGTGLTFADFSGGIYMNRFDVGDIFYIHIQLPHDMKVDTPVYPHLHLAVNSAIGATNYNVEVTTKSAWANINAAFGVPATVSTGLVCSFQNAAQYTHKILTLSTLTPGITEDGISSYVIFAVERITASVAPINPAQSVFIMGMDIHYQTDTMGSRQETAK